MTVVPLANDYALGGPQTVVMDGETFFDGDMFAVTLTNISAGPITVSTFSPVVFRILAVSVNGLPADLSVQTVFRCVNPFRRGVAALTTLPPGGQASFQAEFSDSTFPDSAPYLGGREGTGKAVTGSYQVTVGYQYSGPDGGLPNVYRGVVVAAPVAFTVH